MVVVQLDGLVNNDARKSLLEAMIRGMAYGYVVGGVHACLCTPRRRALTFIVGRLQHGCASAAVCD